MSAQDYQLFEGRLNFAGMLFDTVQNCQTQTAVNVATTTIVTAAKPIPYQRMDSPRPITKTGVETLEDYSHDLNSQLQSPEGSPRSLLVAGMGMRQRSLSGSSGGSEAGGRGGVPVWRIHPPQRVQCVLCRRNGEAREFYSTHTLKDHRGMVVCPVLRSYTCPRCGATGGSAHTESHCPLSEHQPSLMASLRTRRSSCGKKNLRR